LGSPGCAGASFSSLRCLRLSSFFCRHSSRANSFCRFRTDGFWANWDSLQTLWRTGDRPDRSSTETNSWRPRVLEGRPSSGLGLALSVNPNALVPRSTPHAASYHAARQPGVLRTALLGDDDDGRHRLVLRHVDPRGLLGQRDCVALTIRRARSCLTALAARPEAPILASFAHASPLLMMTSISLASAEVRKPFPSATPVEQITEMRQKIPRPLFTPQHRRLRCFGRARCSVIAVPPDGGGTRPPAKFGILGGGPLRPFPRALRRSHS